MTAQLPGNFGRYTSPETLDQLQRRRLLGPEVYYCEGSHRAGHRCGFGPRSRCMQHRQTLRRSLWRALRRPSLWVAGCRHMPLLLTYRSSARCPSRHGLVLPCRTPCCQRVSVLACYAKRRARGAWCKLRNSTDIGEWLVMRLIKFGIDQEGFARALCGRSQIRPRNFPDASCRARCNIDLSISDRNGN